MAELKHRKCGGIVSVDIASQFSLRTHSIMITPTEVKLGVLELNVSNKSGKAVLVCNRCDEKFDESGLENVTAMCLVCSKNKSVLELYTSYPFPCICQGCIDEASGKGKKDKKEKSKLEEVFNLSLSGVKFVSFAEILSKPIG